MRTFLALWPDSAWCERLLVAAAPALSAAGGRPTARADLHVTLRFLGATEPGQLEALCARLAVLRWQPFTLQFVRLEWWRESRVLAAVAADVPAAAAELVRSLAAAAQACGIGADPKPFRPHITLARGVSHEARIEAPALDSTLQAGAVCLARSDPRPQGAQYTILERWSR